MKKLFLLILFTVTVFVVNGQNNVGIGTSTPSVNAILHLENGASNLGLLLPNLDHTGFTPLPSDSGLIVFDNVLNEIFYWDGSAWFSATQISTLQTAYNASQIVNMGSGNIDFISSAANSLLYIDEANERIGIGTNTPNAQLEVTQEIVVNGIEIGKGFNNDNRSTGVGLRTLDVTNLAAANTVFGYEAGWQITNGTDNVAVGTQALTQNTTGSTNTAVGGFALQNNFTGSNNTAIGALADVSVDGLNNATAIGANSVVSQNNSLILGNNANVGIGTSTPVNKLEVIGDAAKFDSVIIVNGAQVGYVLTAADATGAASWQPAGAGSSWDLLGNAGTVDGTNFIGTTDNVPLNIRVNNQISGRIDPLGPTFLGYQAGLVNTDLSSTGIGFEALKANTTGTENVAIGSGALKSNTIGFGNTASGAFALQVNSSGAWNTASGNYALGNNITGSFNTAFGRNTLVNNVAGNTNTAMGYQALRDNTNNGNSAFGSQALLTNTTGSNNTAIGISADVASGALTNATAIGANAIVGSSNSLVLGNNANVGIGTTTPTSKLEVVGGDALINSLTVGRGSGNDISNTAFGNQALAANLAAGLANTAIGQSALSSNTTGTSSTALGFYALRLNTTGYSNVAVGHGALDNNSIGFENTAVGQGALQGNTTGSRNTSIGRGTLTNNTTGSYNIAMGWEALVGHQSGNYNTAIGNDVLRNNSVGSNNTGVGSFAVQGTTGGNNSGFGNSALRNNTTGSDNTAIGFSADVASGALTNATAIGANTIVGASNSLVLGNNVNVGIGTSTPANRLEVIGDAAKFDSVIIANNAQAGYVLTSADATGAASWQPAAGGVSGTGATNKLAYWTGANTLSFNTGLHYESGNQRLGLGTAAPAEFLHVNSGNPITVASRFTNSTTGFTGSDGFGFGITGTGNAFINNDEATPINISTASTTRMTIGATGNIGIGNNAPNAPLQFATANANRKIVLFEGVNDDHQFFGFGTNAASLRYQINQSFSSHIFYAGVNATTSVELMRIQGNGNVGIGTSTPQGRLHVANSNWNAGSMLVSTPAGSVGSAIRFTNADAGNHTYDIIGSTGLSAGAGVGSFAIYDNTLSAYRLTINPNGNVGIGTSAPAFKLDVSGTARVTGEAEINGTQFVTTASNTPVIDNQFRVNSGAIANVIFYTACACPTVAAVLLIDQTGIVKILSQAGTATNSIAGSGTSTLTLNDCCGSVVPYVFSIAGGIVTISYPSGFFTTAKWVVTSI